MPEKICDNEHMDNKRAKGRRAAGASKGNSQGKHSPDKPVTIGRPSEYNPDMVTFALQYAVNYAQYGDPVPSIAGLACELGVAKQSIYNWAAKHRDFMDALNIIACAQERRAVAGGLTGEFNPAITGKVLANHDGYSEKQSLDLKSSDKSMSPSEPRADLSKLPLEVLDALRNACPDNK